MGEEEAEEDGFVKTPFITRKEIPRVLEIPRVSKFRKQLPCRKTTTSYDKYGLKLIIFYVPFSLE